MIWWYNLLRNEAEFQWKLSTDCLLAKSIAMTHNYLQKLVVSGDNPVTF